METEAASPGHSNAGEAALHTALRDSQSASSWSKLSGCSSSVGWEDVSDHVDHRSPRKEPSREHPVDTRGAAARAGELRGRRVRTVFGAPRSFFPSVRGPPLRVISKSHAVDHLPSLRCHRLWEGGLEEMQAVRLRAPEICLVLPDPHSGLLLGHLLILGGPRAWPHIL